MTKPSTDLSAEALQLHLVKLRRACSAMEQLLEQADQLMANPDANPAEVEALRRRIGQVQRGVEKIKSGSPGVQMLLDRLDVGTALGTGHADGLDP